MPVSPPAAGQVDSELRRSQTQRCDLAPGGCPASCPDAHRPTHGRRHVRNWAIAHISDVGGLDKIFFLLPAPATDGWADPLAKVALECRSAACGERLHAPGVADEGGHHRHAAQKEDAL